MRKLGLLVFLAVLPALAMFGCSSSSSGGGGGGSINMSGGLGGADGGYGGDSDDLILEKYAGFGEVAIRKSGAADARFTLLGTSAFLGDNPLTISADTTIAVYDTEVDTPPAEGTPYLLRYYYTGTVWVGDFYLRISDGDTDFTNEELVTGVTVAKGATLTLELNYNGETQARIDLENDIDIKGTLKTADIDDTARGDLNLYVDSFHCSGTLTSSGSVAGQDGGDIHIHADGNIVNHGTIITAGADNSAGDGGDGGDFDTRAEYGLENTGPITTSGGNATGTTGYGGNAGGLDNLEVDFGSLNNSGDLTAKGGNGIDGGGDGANIDLYVCCLGQVRNSGNLDSSGGNATAGDGGNGGDIDGGDYAFAYVSSGKMTSKGGSTTDTASSGGYGGDIWIYVYEGEDYIYDDYFPAGDLLISGAIDTSGGNAVASGSGSGGDAGWFDLYLENDNGNYQGEQRLALLGYGTINMSGGDGNYGGSGDYVDLYNWYDYNYEVKPCGPVVNEANIDISGGDVVAAATGDGYGGDGGSVNFETDYSDEFALHLHKINVVNTGDIDASGGTSNGASGTYQANGDWVYFYGYEGVENSGNITTRGGNDLAAEGYGGYGGGIEMFADAGPTVNSGNLDSSGGDGAYEGGGARYIELAGLGLTNRGDLTAKGGDADATVAGSSGGNGDDIDLYVDAVNSGSLSVKGGTGETKGDDGEAIVSGQRVL